MLYRNAYYASFVRPFGWCHPHGPQQRSHELHTYEIAPAQAALKDHVAVIYRVHPLT